MKEETNKSKIIFITALVCIALCIPIGVLLGWTLLGKNDKTNNNVVNNTQNIIDKNSDDYKEVEKALNSFEKNFKISYKNLYNGNYNIKNISDEDKLKSVIKLMENDGLIKSSCENDRDIITYDKVNEYLNDFNLKVLNIESNEKYNEDKIKGLTKQYANSKVYTLDNYYNIEFKDNGLDISRPCDALGGIFSDNRIINTSKDNNNLIVYAKVYFSKPGFIYKDYAGKNVIYEATIENNFIDDNLDKFDTYKYTFKIDNGSYTFVSLEKI